MKHPLLMRRLNRRFALSVSSHSTPWIPSLSRADGLFAPVGRQCHVPGPNLVSWVAACLQAQQRGCPRAENR
jgi:hypothetical protein